MSKVNKRIDFDQFPMDKKGHILWRECVGLTVKFYYYDKLHLLKILEQGTPTKDDITIQVDDFDIETVKTNKIRKLQFDRYFYEPNYFYKTGQIVNDFLIVEQTKIQKVYNRKTVNSKGYKCKCIHDNSEYIFTEKELKNGKKCLLCTCLATTDPDIMKYLLYKEDGYKYTRCSHKKIWAVCPYCGFKKLIRIEDLVHKDGLSCKRCSDGLSYPNKFTYRVLEQLNEQYLAYIPEYSPDWLDKKRFDNFIILKDGSQIVIEMDGGFHYNGYRGYSIDNDITKDNLAAKHGIKVIRINCYYNNTANRFNMIKNGLIENLKEYFDLSKIDWRSAHEAGITNKLVEITDYYKQHPYDTTKEIANHFHLNVETIRHYLKIGEELGFCTYIRHDGNRYKTSISLLLYDLNQNFIKAFVSIRHLSEEMKHEGFVRHCIEYAITHNKPYKGYIIKQTTWEEYQKYQKI